MAPVMSNAFRETVKLPRLTAMPERGGSTGASGCALRLEQTLVANCIARNDAEPLHYKTAP